MGKSKQSKHKQKEGKSYKPSRRGNLHLVAPADTDTFVPRAARRAVSPIQGLNAAQQRYIEYIRSKDITFGIGPAGTGKTYVAGALGCEGILSNKLDRLVLTRPAEAVDEDWGLVPGDITEKFMPYLIPYLDVLEERLGRGGVDYFMKEQGRIRAVPLGLMRGMTIKHSLVILDEAQNATKKQLKMFLTRIGEGCTVIVNGDLSQIDLPRGKSGLRDAVNRFHHLPSVGVALFSKKDVVRNDIIQEIIEGYDRPISIKHPGLAELYGDVED